MRLIVAVAWLVLAGCGPSHINSYTPKDRRYTGGEQPHARARPATDGALMPDETSGSLFSDARAFREHDILVVKIEEVADAQRKADTDLNKSSGIVTVLAALPFIGRFVRPNPPLNLEQEARFEGNHELGFKGNAASGRSEHLLATVPVVVKQVLSNGNLFVEGHRVILVNNEEHHLYVSGVVRPIDIDQDNSIKSSQVADAEIEFVGRGRMTDTQEQGWLSRFFNWLSPF